MTLAEQLQQAIANLDTANASVTSLTAQVGTISGERDAARANVTTLTANVTTLTGERDTLKASNGTLTAQVGTLTAENATLKASQATAEEIARRQLAKVGQPAVGADTSTGTQKDESKMSLTEKCQARLEAKGTKAS